MKLIALPIETSEDDVKALRRLLRAAGVGIEDALVLAVNVGKFEVFEIPASGIPKKLSLKDEMLYEGRVSQEGIDKERKIAHELVSTQQRTPGPEAPFVECYGGLPQEEPEPYERRTPVEAKYRNDVLPPSDAAAKPPTKVRGAIAELGLLRLTLRENEYDIACRIYECTLFVPVVNVIRQDEVVVGVNVTYQYLDRAGDEHRRTVAQEDGRPEEMVLHALRTAMSRANRDHNPRTT